MKLADAFCVSPYLDQCDYADTLETLQELFYEFKNLCGERLEDDELIAAMDTLLAAYQAEYSGDRNVLHRMKELWYYWGCLFPDSARQRKRILKAQTCADYRAAVDALFRERPMFRE